MSGESLWLNAWALHNQALLHDVGFKSREPELWWNETFHLQKQIRKSGTLEFTLLITVHFLKKKKKVDIYVKDSEVKVIDFKARTTRVWWKSEIKGKQRSKILNE